MTYITQHYDIKPDIKEIRTSLDAIRVEMNDKFAGINKEIRDLTDALQKSSAPSKGDSNKL